MCKWTETLRGNKDRLWKSDSCVNILKSGPHKLTLLVYVQCSWVWVFALFFLCGGSVWVCSSTMAVWGIYTHSCLLSRDLQGGSQNKIPSADYFSCDQKIYMFSQGGMLRRLPTAHFHLLCFSHAGLFGHLPSFFCWTLSSLLWLLYFAGTKRSVNLMNLQQQLAFFFHLNNLSHVILGLCCFLVPVFIYPPLIPPS